MSISLMPAIKERILKALFCNEPFETSPFVHLDGRARMRFDNMVIELVGPDKVRVSFAWRGKDIMFLENNLDLNDRLNVVMDGAFDVRID